jgi:ATP-dependent Clp protease ATP-binding subunit ClpA
VSLYQLVQAGLTCAQRPIGVLLFLGPTGTGKTRVVEAAAEVLFGTSNAVVKVDCAEFQHSHEIAKLIGSPPGYLGHRETSPVLSQENLSKHCTESDPFTFVLFDEIEKASDALWQLLLGVFDKATLTLGDNRRVDFSRTMIFMTSNLGAKEMSALASGFMGFAPAQGKGLDRRALDDGMTRTALAEARKNFSPEFMNRIDNVVVFGSLTDDELSRILDVELNAVQDRIDQGSGPHFTFTVSDEAKRFLLAEGTDSRYGARHLRRAIENNLVQSFANLISTRQVKANDLVAVELDDRENKLRLWLERPEPITAAIADLQDSRLTTDDISVAA